MTTSIFQALTDTLYGVGAQIVGQSYQWYRGQDPEMPVICSQNLMGQMSLYLNPDPNLKSVKPSQSGKPVWYAMVDRTNTLVGDFFVGPLGTLFIQSQQSLLATALIQCNDVLTFSRPHQRASYDPSLSQSGTPSQYQDICIAVPASVLDKSRAEKSDVGLPLDPKFGTFEVLLPDLGVQIRTSDRITDRTGNQYSVESVELTPLGYRLLITSENA